ncbi:MAG: zinc transport system ATP-binding protein [Pseudomonadales bacterium]|jgi:zinc transport system ATP-binding protein
MLIDAKKLSFARGGKTILQDISMQVSRGEIVTIIGPNGAGKSSLLKILLGLEKHDSGTLQTNAKLRVGYMPQQLQLSPHLPLTVERFLALAKASKDEIKIAAQTVSITGLLGQAMQNLSGGEQQRVLLARAILRKPNLLVLDEPVQGVDIGGQAALYRLIGQLRDQLNCGVLMVSHDLHLVMAETDTVVCLNQHICCEGHPDIVSAHPAYLELFGKPLDSALALYTHHHDHTHEHGESCSHDASEK